MIDRVKCSARSGCIPLTLEWQGAMKRSEDEEKENQSGGNINRPLSGVELDPTATQIVIDPHR